jgi:hypothetical protein
MTMKMRRSEIKKTEEEKKLAIPQARKDGKTN